MQTMQQVARAQQDRAFLEDFLKESQPFILRAASRCAGFAVTRSDDEFSVALFAFYEAVRTYDAEAGAFPAWARLIISRRLTDHYRAVRRFSSEVPLAPQVFDGAVESDDADAEVQRAVVEKIANPATATAAEEIETANALFAPYGFCFYDLGKCSPRAEKTRKGCAAVVATLLHTSDLFRQLERTHTLPVQALAQHSGVKKKLIERHREYIIAAALLLRGEFPTLAAYLQTIRKEVASCGL